jgi:hypothetical protein
MIIYKSEHARSGQLIIIDHKNHVYMGIENYKGENLLISSYENNPYQEKFIKSNREYSKMNHKDGLIYIFACFLILIVLNFLECQEFDNGE